MLWASGVWAYSWLGIQKKEKGLQDFMGLLFANNIYFKQI
jgi:hypothetical protein